MELRQIAFDAPEVAPLLAGMEEEYRVRYGVNDEMRYTSVAEFEPPSGCFLVVLDGSVTAAGGGFRRYDDATCEIKRMWTRSTYRRQGLAEQILEQLTHRARQAGYARLILETGALQPEAAALYTKRGYRRIPVYGRYPDALAFETELGSGYP